MNSDLLGFNVKDEISGFSGVATECTTFLNGCIRYTLQPKTDKKTGKLPESHAFDDQQLVAIGRRIMEPIPLDNRQVFEMMEKVVDDITGTKGVVVAICVYIDGTIRYGFQDKMKPSETEPVVWWQDSEILKPVGRKPAKKKLDDTGGPTSFMAPHK